MAEYLTGLEQEKKKSGELADLLALTEQCVSEHLAEAPRRGALVLQALKSCRERAVYYPGPGHTLGWLSSELFRGERV